MDYCSVCRRHINGALSCPGCGTPVEEALTEAGFFGVSDGAPESAPRSVPESAAGSASAEPAGPEYAVPQSGIPESAGPGPGAAADPSASPATGGRAERRRAAAGQGAGAGRSRRSRKIRARRRNRILLGVTVGLCIVMAAAWSVGELPIVDFHTGGDAVTDVNIRESGSGTKPSLPGTDPDIAAPTDGADTLSTGSPSPSPSRSAGRRSASPEPSRTPSHHQSTAPARTGTGGSSGQSPSAQPPARPRSPHPTTPSASPTCTTRFLWWCA
jgi:hypothetical protein